MARLTSGGRLTQRAKRRWWWPFGGKRNKRIQLMSSLARAAAVRESAPRPQRRRDLRHLLRPLVLLITVGGMIGSVVGLHRWVRRSPHFAVRAVAVSPTRHLTAEAIQARSGIELGENLFGVDLSQVARDVQADPWVLSATAHRELPGVIAIEVAEREPACAVSLGSLYLADDAGAVFKRATIEETVSLPVVTGLTRDGYVEDREATQLLIREALSSLALWRERDRAAIGEVHVDAAVGVTLYTVQDGVGVRLGRGEAAVLRERLRLVDAVWRALADKHERPRLILVDQKSRPDRVTVKLAQR